ncbi:unnamed protein product, partial [Brenthis ino]
MHPGRTVNQSDMAKLFGVAYAKSASVQNAINVFKKPGICPYDPHVFREEDYTRSLNYDRLLPDAPSSTTPLSDSNILEEGSAHSQGENHPALAASLTPFQIRSIQTMAAPKTGRKYKRQESEVLTSTPVKAEQTLKFKKANIKKTKISE